MPTTKVRHYNAIMANQKRSLLGGLGGPLYGATMDPNTGLIGRTFERKQGCWNCVHFSFERGLEMWKSNRQRDLEVGASLALQSPMGERDPKVMGIRSMVDTVDKGMATHQLGACDGTGLDANDNPVGDLVKANYLCRKWSAAQGASVAKGAEAADPLPMELDDKTS